MTETLDAPVIPKLVPGTWYCVTWEPRSMDRPLGARCARRKFHSEVPGFYMFTTEPFVGMLPVAIGYVIEIKEVDQ